MNEKVEVAGAAIRVLVAEDEAPVRAAICDLLSFEDGIEVVAVAADADEAIARALAMQPAVALLDAKMPGGGGPRAAREIAKVAPGTNCVALSAYDDRGNVTEMLCSGAIGYIVKGTPSVEIVEAVRRAARGQASLPARLIADLFTELPPDSDRLFESVVEHAQDAVVVADGLGRIVLVNARAERLFRQPRAELTGAQAESLLPNLGDHRPGPEGARLELMAKRNDGTTVAVDASISRFETPGGWMTAAFVRDDSGHRERDERDREQATRRAVLARVVAAGEEERRQIAAGIHDDSIQVMTAAGMRLQILRRSLESPDQLARLDELERSIELSIARLRHLIFELRPPALDFEGLGAAIRLYVDDAPGQKETTYEIDDHLGTEPSEAARLILYRLAQEVLSNVRKHAAAENVKVTVSDHEAGYHVRIVDDGVGFSPGAELQLGLAAIRERAELAGGWLRVESAPGQGTSVEYWIARADR